MSRNKDGTINTADLSSKTGEWYTPDEPDLQRVRVYFDGPIPLDPFTRADNPTKAEVFFTPEENGCLQDWSVYRGCFTNPPYGVKNGGNEALIKIAEEAAAGLPIIMLINAARFETDMGQDCIITEHVNAMCFRKRRIKFKRPDGTVGKSNTWPSIYYGYNVDLDRFVLAFKPLGRVYATQAL
jgi:hypothetical protein